MFEDWLETEDFVIGEKGEGMSHMALVIAELYLKEGDEENV